MNDLPPKEPDRPELEKPPMTALTLDSVLNQGFDPVSDAASAAARMTASEEIRAAVPVEEMDDHALLEATRTGDHLAFNELVRRYKNPITNFVYRMLNDYDRAVDLAQETFMRVFTSAISFDLISLRSVTSSPD